MLDRLNETIVALSSAPGHGPIGILRLSGPRATEIGARIAPANSRDLLRSRPGSTRFDSEVDIGDGAVLPATFYLFRGPRSYTRQDLVEIHTVGSPAALELVRRRTLNLGALPAEPGEFTARAFLRGGMEMAKAEAVAGIIRAQTDTQLRASRLVSDGRLAVQLRKIRDELAELVALVEADIDFAEEPIDFITPVVLGEHLTRIAAQLQQLVVGSLALEQFDNYPQILLFGPPNAGKSSLMNRLSGTNRAICAATAGTTRDVLSAPIRIGKGEAILLDAAGIDLTDEEIISQARARSLAVAETVDVLCVVVDASVPIEEHVWDAASSVRIREKVIAANKADLLSSREASNVAQRLSARGLGPVWLTSAVDGRGLEDLRRALSNALSATATTALGESILINERQKAALQGSINALDRAAELCSTARETIDCADLLAVELREALNALGTITGEVTTEDLLGQIFADFCIGK